MKNYEGEFIYREESLYKINSKLEIINPLYRLTRSKLLFKQLLKELGYGHFSVEAYIVFINPNFTLYEAPHLPNLLRLSNLERHFKQIDVGLVPLKDDHQLLASKLCAQINPDNLDYNLPEYGYDSLEKGTSCLKCGRFIGKTVDKHYTCKSCGHQEPSNAAVFRHIQEYQRLFPTQKVTVSMIYDWCGRVPSRNRIRSVLQSRFQQKSVGRGVYYV